ncbi:MAG TPA: M48 family metallopeptidase [Planctomycetota bacterium]|nr:M48 family metallopeptidase [Planctomycetota bacterium]
MKRAGLCLLLLAGCVKTVTGGREQTLGLDLPSEFDLGVRGCQAALARSAISEDPAEAEAILRVGKRLAAVVARPKFRWEFHVLADDQATSAWCLPGGKFGLSTGLFPALEDEAGAAFVMAHELAHTLLRHGAERISEKLLKEEVALLGRSTVGAQDAELEARALACYGVFLEGSAAFPFGPDHESEADRLGMELMAKAGYDPRLAREVWKRIEARPAGGLLQVHPSHPLRIRNLESRLSTAMALYEQAIKAGVSKLPLAAGARRTKPGEAKAPPGSIVASAVGTLRTTTKENRHALLFEFWLNQDVYLDRVQVSGPGGISLPVRGGIAIPANLKGQATLVRPDPGDADYPAGTYTFTLTGAASGRWFEASCAYEVR